MDIISVSENEDAAEASRDHDFWDHLRRIHFFIVAASVVLALGALAREEGRLFTANRLTQEIAFAATKPFPNLDSLKAAAVVEKAPATLYVFNGDAPIYFGGRSQVPVHPRYRVAISRKVLFFGNIMGTRALEDTPPRARRDSLRTLAQWAALWNRFRDERACRLAPGLYPIELHDPRNSGAAQLYGMEAQSPEWLPQAWSNLAGNYVASYGHDGALRVAIVAGEPVRPGSPADRLGLGHTATVIIEINCTPRRLGAQARLARLAGAEWTPGPYERSFADLEYFFGDESVTLAEASEYLKARIANGSADVQVVGIPMPSRLLVNGGFALLIGLQLYFLLHLRAILRRTQTASAAPEIAWIGAYDDLISWACYTVSICVLPLFSGYVLLTTALGRSHHSPWLAVLAFTAQAALCVMTLFYHPRKLRETEYRRALRGVARIIVPPKSVRPEPAPLPEPAGTAPSDAAPGPAAGEGP